MLENAQLASANDLVLLAIIFMLFGQHPAPKVMTSPVEVAKLLQDALDTQPTIISQPNDDNLFAPKEKLLDVLQTISYDRADGFHHVAGVTTKAMHFPSPNALASGTTRLQKMQQ